MKPSLPKRVHHVLRTRLLDGSLPPGTRLDYKKLALELDVSTTPVREAVAQLASEGFVELIPRLGAVVRSLDRSSAMEIYEVREAIETFAALKAAERLSARHLGLLREHHATMVRLSRGNQQRERESLETTELRAFVDADHAFHKTILLGARNRSLARTLEESHVQSRIFHTNRKTLHARRLTRVCDQHGEILMALEKRDGPAAAEAMRTHILTSLEFTLDHLEVSLESGM